VQNPTSNRTSHESATIGAQELTANVVPTAMTDAPGTRDIAADHRSEHRLMTRK
jgi:hypothetical protein